MSLRIQILAEFKIENGYCVNISTRFLSQILLIVNWLLDCSMPLLLEDQLLLLLVVISFLRSYLLSILEAISGSYCLPPCRRSKKKKFKTQLLVGSSTTPKMDSVQLFVCY